MDQTCRIIFADGFSIKYWIDKSEAEASPTTGAIATSKDESAEKSATKVSADEGTSSNWKEMTDKKSGRIFYYNKVTKKTQWTKPNEDSKNESSGGSLTSRKLPTKKMRKRSTVIQSLEDNWQEMKDPKSGKTFYYNTITGVSAWEIPSVSTSKSASQDDKKDKKQGRKG